jgi:hypothetical protein
LLEAVKVRLGYRDEGTDFQRTKKPTKEKDAPPCINFLTTKAPYRGLGADSEEKHEPARDIDTAAVDSLKALDLERPIREGASTKSRCFFFVADGMPAIKPFDDNLYTRRQI